MANGAYKKYHYYIDKEHCTVTAAYENGCVLPYVPSFWV